MKRLFSFFLSGLFFIASVCAQSVNPSTALDAYLNNNDPTWAWEVRDSYPVDKTQAYSLLLISQKWQGILWRHELMVLVPEKVGHDGALLFISGSAVENGLPKTANPNDGTLKAMAVIAAKNQAVVAIIRQVPNQPLYGGLNEDALISYTLNGFRKDGDFSWPLLFPMVKSARKAMDAVQEFTEQKTGVVIRRFVVAGASKRGWATWLTGASQDPRVIAIAPMVIDVLNMPATLEYQKEMYGGAYSEEIQDYVKLEIPQVIKSEFGQSVVEMIDPYSYRTKLTMPKMLFMGTNDPYWTIDAVKLYIDEIPGQNYLCYVPNAGHGLGDKKQVYSTLSAFFGLSLNRKPYPECQWTLTEKGKKITLNIKTSTDQPVRAVLWTAESSGRDFRHSHWTGKALPPTNTGVVQVTTGYPKKDFSAFYVELVYKDPNGGEYSITTRPYVAGTKQVFVK
ncbi:MAG: PhoPQ-activated pathogenicity-related family protein [Bacteroidales bacterium]|jgi:PhoPQ-activated pathogenicity-related protein|nr:PhoPQ-activated pathogenicity-related family protein [Bacteroidales bacterium]